MQQDNNNLGDVRNHLFGALEKLSDPNANLDKELKRANAITSVSAQIIASAKVEVEAMKLVKGAQSAFIPLAQPLPSGESKKLPNGDQ